MGKFVSEIVHHDVFLAVFDHSVSQHFMTHFPTSLRVNEQASKQMNAAEQANEELVQANETIDKSGFLVVLDHSGMRNLVIPFSPCH